jgi:maltose-binding protein MalE
MKKYLIAVIAVLVCYSLISPVAFAKDKRFDGVTLKVFANSHEPMLRANKWSIDVVKEKFGIDILMDESPYGTQYEKATSAFVAGTGQYDIIVAAHQWTGGGPKPGTSNRLTSS